MSVAVGGPEPKRVVQVVAHRQNGTRWFGSGYLMTGDLVITAQHVLGDADDVTVRFIDAPSQVRSEPGKTVWVHAGIDVAVVRLFASMPGTTPVRYGRLTTEAQCEAVGYPWFKLRGEGARTGAAHPGVYRDSHHARATCTPLSNRRSGTLELAVAATPSRHPDPKRSAWEGMSGAAVFADGALVAMLTENFPKEGPGILTARPVEQWYTLPPNWLSELRELIGIPDSAGRLIQISAQIPLHAVQPPLADLPSPPAPQIPDWAVARSDELEEVVAALCAQPGTAVGITTGLEGAGGFGKSMLASMACADERVREHFEGRVYTVTMGRDVREQAAITAKVIEAIRFITGHTVTYTDPGMAGDELGRLLDQHPGRRVLLELDDVWTHEQLDPFLRGGRECVRLITTRVPDVLPDGAARVLVDRMTPTQARAVLGRDLPSLPENLVRDLIAATGQWALLLRLANRWMWRQVRVGAEAAVAAEHLLVLLREEGPAAADPSRPPPDPADPVQRRKMVRATVQAATGLLTAGARQGLAELGIFAEDEPVPVLVAARLWRATTGLSESQARDRCYELGGLSLVTVEPDGGGFLVLHDVIRDYLRHELGSDRITALNTALIDAIQGDLPAAEPLTAAAPGPPAAWWALAENLDTLSVDRYLADHAIPHLLAAGRAEDAEAVACDIRWIEARLHGQGPTAPWGDCARVPTATAARRARDLAQAAHLLAPTVPAYALTDVLHTRLGSLPGWCDQVAARQRQQTRPALRSRWSPPDLPHPALIRVLDNRPGSLSALAIAPDGTWLATGGKDGTVRIWDPAAGRQTAHVSHAGLSLMQIAPDGTWLATGGKDGTVRIWDPITGRQKAIPSGLRSGASAGVSIAPDGTWTATGSDDGIARIGHPVTGHQDAILPDPIRRATRIAAAPDGTWIAGSDDETAWIWNLVTGKQARSQGRLDAVAADGTWLAIRDGKSMRTWNPAACSQTGGISGPDGGLTAMAIAPDGTWIATGSDDGIVRIWDPVTSQQTATVTRFIHWVAAIAIAPDGSWLAASDGMGARVWDPANGRQIGKLTGQQVGAGIFGSATKIAVAPDGTWFAMVSDSDGSFRTPDGVVRIWHPDGGQQVSALAGHAGNETVVAIAPDGTWLATGDDGGKVRIWDPISGEQIKAFVGHDGKVTAIAVAPDGTWFATAGDDGVVRIWDPDGGQQVSALTNRLGKETAVAVAPDGTWVATGDDSGKVRIWDPASGAQIRAFTVHDGEVTAMAVAPDGKWLASAGGWDAIVRHWDLFTGRQGATLPGHMGQVIAITIAPDATWLATADDGGGGTVRIWDLATRQAKRIRPFNMPEPTILAIAPDSTCLATARGRSRTAGPWDDLVNGHGETVRIWDPVSGRQTAALIGYDGRVTAVAIAPGGAWLATADTEDAGVVRIWDPVSGQQTGTLTGHDGTVTAIAITADGGRLATTDEHGTIRIWDKASKQPLAMMRTDGAALHTCTWTPDRSALIVTSSRGVHCYEFHPGTHGLTLINLVRTGRVT